LKRPMNTKEIVDLVLARGLSVEGPHHGQDSRSDCSGKVVPSFYD